MAECKECGSKLEKHHGVVEVEEDGVTRMIGDVDYFLCTGIECGRRTFPKETQDYIDSTRPEANE